MFRRLGEFSVRTVPRVHERYVAVVTFRLSVHQIKHSLRTGDTHDDGCDLMRDLVDIPGKLLRHVEERHNDAYAESQTRERNVFGVRHQKYA